MMNSLDNNKENQNFGNQFANALTIFAKQLEKQTDLLSKLLVATEASEGKKKPKRVNQEKRTGEESSSEGAEEGADDQDFEIRSEIKQFEDDRIARREKWENVTNDNIIAVLACKSMYIDAACRCFPALHVMAVKIGNRGLVTPFKEQEGKDFMEIIKCIVNRERTRMRGLWLDFLHEVCDRHFNELEPRETGLILFLPVLFHQQLIDPQHRKQFAHCISQTRWSDCSGHKTAYFSQWWGIRVRIYTQKNC